MSFGDDPDQEPWLRRWVAAHRKVLAIGTATIVLLALIAGGGWHLYQQSRKPLPPPAVALPEQTRFIVWLCQEEICPGPGTPRPGDVRRVETALRSMPEVVSIKFSRNRSQGSQHPGTIMDPATGHGIGPVFFDAFDGRLRRSSDFPAVAAKLKGMAVAQRLSTDFWFGKADVTVTLCGTSADEACSPFLIHDMTEEQKQAVLDRIREIDGVRQVYYEDRQHALTLQQHYHPETSRSDPPLILAAMKETYRVKMSGPDAVRRLQQALNGVPGVESVMSVAPFAY
ncbi:permease-like cell division protein FtsX [Sphaerisporangium rubeum]|uniref:FtsX extracellular domain-containing protein n=1 Tax=Sphaerisporangium rubeum TaxID=321317 RepID=A0A7X0IBK5_9ACTN|nr:permease-like cell division protein FtsX [Sphaerisporangium rubeum]MBB6470667.1 hypothetical protein [Sphaerisporangium rubeum]